MVTRRHGTTHRPDGQPAPSLPRCALVEVAATATAGLVLRLLAPDVVAARDLVAAGVPFDALLAGAAAVLLALCVGWGWLAATSAVLEAVTGLRVPRAACPPVVRRAMLLACGVALVAGLSPAQAAPDGTGPVAAARAPGDGDRSMLAGLPMPDRPAGPARRSVAPTPVLARAPQVPVAPRPGEVVVLPGDTLWDLAVGDLPAGATRGEVAVHWQLIWAVNRSTVGADPDLIRPGTTLRLPPRKDA